jgi:hypothetical protein
VLNLGAGRDLRQFNREIRMSLVEVRQIRLAGRGVDIQLRSSGHQG